MAMMNLSLPDSIKAFIDEQVADRGFETGDEYVVALLRQEAERERFKALIREGLESPIAGVADDAYFEQLRDRLRKQA